MTKRLLSISVVAYGGEGFKAFDYLSADVDMPTIGSIVKVPFGPHTSLGVVLESSPFDQPAEQASEDAISKILPILGVVVSATIPKHLLGLASWMSEYYAASPRAVWRTILPSGLEQAPRLKAAPPLSVQKKLAGLELTQQQTIAITTIEAKIQRGYLLHGITGSGKTEVYIQLIREQIRQGRSCIVLVPEIALAPQMIERLSQHFGNRVIVNHSKLTPARRKKVWLDCLASTEPQVVVGPRSSLFLPLQNLGLVVVDEEHESSYKQENPPTYQVNAVVAKLCELSGATYVLGSATPSIQSYAMAQAGKIGYIRLTQRATGAELPVVEIIDLKDSDSMLSPSLVRQMQDVLRRGRQVLLFLNRRGSASALVCHDCGHIINCPNCDTSLTFHGDIARLVCHYCNYKALPPTSCPVCHKTDLGFVGSGTKKVEAKLHELFGKYRIGRLDSDNADIAHLETIYNQLRSGELDIVIGTQMIARGLDIAGIELVGVVSTESMLAIPDFSSSERTFQLLTQVAGRAGRGTNPGRAIIQTYSPTHPAVIAASGHDYGMFYENELASRRAHTYPPFTYLVKLVYGHVQQQKAIAQAQAVADEIRLTWPQVTVLGPAERMVKRVGGRYQQRIIIKAKRRSTLLEITHSLKPGWKYDLDPISLT